MYRVLCHLRDEIINDYDVGAVVAVAVITSTYRVAATGKYQNGTFFWYDADNVGRIIKVLLRCRLKVTKRT